MVLKKWFTASIGALVLCTVMFCIAQSSYAQITKPRVVSSKAPLCQKCQLLVVHPSGPCSGGGVPGLDPVELNKFNPGEMVYAKGFRIRSREIYRFKVDIYVLPDQDWELGDTFGPKNPSSPQNVTPKRRGKLRTTVGRNGVLPCTKVWDGPLTPGLYDIIVDTNKDGTLDETDAIDGRIDIGFRVSGEGSDNTPTAGSAKAKRRRSCRNANKFSVGDEILVKGKQFPPRANVDTYVMHDRDWTLGDTFGPNDLADPQDVTSDGVEIATVNRRGKLRCTTIWGSAEAGKYDIVFDTNGNGTYDEGDVIDGKDNVGFKVK